MTKYSSYLNLFQGNNDHEKLKSLLLDLINHSEGFWDYTSIRYDNVMNKKEWEEFSGHPERKVYKSKISEIADLPFDKAFLFILEILKEAFDYYKQLEDGESKEEFKKLVNSLLETSFNARFDIEEIRTLDEYIGISPDERDNGEISITPFGLQKFRNALRIFSRTYNQDPVKLEEKILTICEGNLLKLSEVIQTCDIDSELRKTIYEIQLIQRRDLTLSFDSIQLAWKIWTIFREIGIDTEEYLSLLGLPSYELIKQRLENFMLHKPYVEEMLKHMEDELPESYKKYKDSGKITRLEIEIENAHRKQYPKSIRSDEEIAKMIQESRDIVYSYFPLAIQENARYLILNPTHPACTSRASNSTVKNTKLEPVNTVTMTPRTDLKDDYLPTFAHEITHALHRMVLNFGEKSGVLKQGAGDSVSSAVMEEFSQLVDSRFDSDDHLPYKKQFTGSEFSNFMSGFTVRFQVPFSLAQLSIRKEFDVLYNSGYKDPLSEEMLWDLKHKFDPMVRKWFSMGLNIVDTRLTAFMLVAPYNPRDGVVYMRRYMMTDLKKLNDIQEIDTNAEVDTDNDLHGQTLKLPDAFIQKWGNKWIDNIDARIMLHWLFLESGRNENSHEYYKFIKNKPIKECLKELEKIGLSYDLIIG